MAERQTDQTIDEREWFIIVCFMVWVIGRLELNMIPLKSAL
jgi:hypothetical protein